jgi:hypothetical protein
MDFCWTGGLLLVTHVLLQKHQSLLPLAAEEWQLDLQTQSAPLLPFLKHLLQLVCCQSLLCVSKALGLLLLLLLM